MGTIINIGGLLAAVLLSEISVSSLIRTGISKFTHIRVTVPDHALPMFTGSALCTVLAVTGFHRLLMIGAAVILFGVAAVPLLRIIRLGVKQGPEARKVAGQRVGNALRGMLQDARYLPAMDLRAILGMVRGARQTEADPDLAGGGYRPVRGGVRTRPPLREDVRLGPVPPAGAVSAELTEIGVAVPASWAMVAEESATFEPEDEDDWLQHWLEKAAGILTVATATQEHGESLAAFKGIDPDVIAAVMEFSDVFADVAPVALMVIRRYHETYPGIKEHVDAGGTLPKDADAWFGAEGTAPEGGVAA